MKIKKSKYILTLVASLLVTTGCEDLLNRSPLDEITTADYWKTTNDLRLYVNQYYPGAFVKYNDGVHLFIADGESDDLITYLIENRRLKGTRIIPPTGGWDYSTIRSLNYFLTHYEQCEDDFEQYKAYVGEALFFRAWFYFMNVQEYGDVPWIDKPLETDSEELYMARTPRNEVIDHLVEDLDRAIEYLPSGKQLGGTRLSREVAQLFKARVCLYEGTWERYHAGSPFGVENPDPDRYLQLAADAALAVIQSGFYSIHSTGDPMWDYFFFAEVDYSANQEVMFWRKYDMDQSLGNARQYYMATGGGAATGFTKALVESYLCTDGRPITLGNGSPNPLYQGDGDMISEITNRDPRFVQTILTPGFPYQIYGTDTIFFERAAVDQPTHTSCPTGYQQGKMLSWDPTHHKSPDTILDGYTGWILFRFAEVLLMYAEAKAELGTLTQADVDMTIKPLRDRVGMPNLDLANIEADPNWLFPDLPDYINEIRRERRVELVGEGHRWHDLARWAAADEVIVGVRPMGAKFNAIDYPGFQASDFSLTNGYFDPLKPEMGEGGYAFDLTRDYLSPISTEELTLNTNLVQNPGWEE
ncbi:MAG: RagB/SusD family nutrient uptake outer membrane protein [Bacteroidota bacterium]